MTSHRGGNDSSYDDAKGALPRLAAVDTYLESAVDSRVTQFQFRMKQKNLAPHNSPKQPPSNNRSSSSGMSPKGHNYKSPSKKGSSGSTRPTPGVRSLADGPRSDPAVELPGQSWDMVEDENGQMTRQAWGIEQGSSESSSVFYELTPSAPAFT